jgi:hypothetical protein
MPKYVVKLWANAPDAQSPTYEVQADSDFHAAALAIRHFTRLGEPVPDTAKLDIEASDRGLQTLSVASVLRWLRRDGEGLAFAREEGLEFLSGGDTGAR